MKNFGAVASVGAVLVSACSAGTDEPTTATLSQPVLGNTFYVGCTAPEQNALRHALLLGRGYAASEHFASCMSSSDYVPCIVEHPLAGPTQLDPIESNPLAAATFAAARGNGTKITCEELAPCEEAGIRLGETDEEDVHGLGHQQTEQFTIDRCNTLNPAVNELAGGTSGGISLLMRVVWHESMHTRGFNHSSIDDGSLVCAGQALEQSMPAIVEKCLSGASTCNDDGSACNEGGTIAFVDGDASYNCACQTLLYDGSTLVNPCHHSDLGNQDYCDEDVEFIGPATPLKHAPGVDLLGSALAVGDFNADGYDDLAAGAPAGDGKVDVYFGSLYGLFSHVRLMGSHSIFEPAGERFGSALAVQDFDGDGYDDLAVGRPGFDGGRGAVTIFHGDLRGFRYLPADRQVLEGAVAGENFGLALGAGRETLLNNQPRVFLVVGAPEVGAGKVYTFSTLPGPAGALTLRSEFVPEGLSSGARFGNVIAAGPEQATPDPSDDVLVSATGAHRVYALDSLDLLSQSAADAAYAEFEAPETGDTKFGASLALASVGSLGVHALIGDPGLGRVYVFDHDVTSDTYDQDIPRITASGPSGFGASIAARQALFPELGSVQGDAFLVGAPASAGGEVHVLRPSDFVQPPLLHQILNQVGLSDTKATDLFGAQVAFGDFDGNSKAEIAIAAPFEALGGNDGSFGNGAIFTYRIDSSTGCTLIAPWKSYSVRGGVGEGVEPVRRWRDGSDISYQAGQIVRHACKFYRATADHAAPSSSATEPGTTGAPWRETTLSPRLPFTTFDTLGEWFATFGQLELDLALFTEGLSSMRVNFAGYTELTSPVFATGDLAEVGQELLLDVFVPTAQPQSGWAGAVQAYVSVPSANVNHWYVGQVDLTPLTRGEFHTASFALPPEVLAALQGQHDDASIHVAVNIASDSPDRVRLDNLRFSP